MAQSRWRRPPSVNDERLLGSDISREIAYPKTAVGERPDLAGGRHQCARADYRHFGFSPFSKQIPNKVAVQINTLITKNAGAWLGGKKMPLAIKRPA
jgi:hypothetical protein